MKALVTFEIPDKYKDMELYYKDGWVYARNIDPDYEFAGLYKLAKCIKIKPLPQKKDEKDAEKVYKTEDRSWTNGFSDGYNYCIDEILGEE